jgi:hypothetical protein
VVASGRYDALKQIRELQRMLGKKTKTIKRDYVAHMSRTFREKHIAPPSSHKPD